MLSEQYRLASGLEEVFNEIFYGGKTTNAECTKIQNHRAPRLRPHLSLKRSKDNDIFQSYHAFTPVKSLNRGLCENQNQVHLSTWPTGTPEENSMATMCRHTGQIVKSSVDGNHGRNFDQSRIEMRRRFIFLVQSDLMRFTSLRHLKDPNQTPWAGAAMKDPVVPFVHV